jgi:hypothetical protein
MRYNIKVNFLKKNLNKIIPIAYAIFLPVISFAQATIVPCDKSGKICNPIPSITSVPGLIKTILEGLLKIGIPVVALAIVYCGFLFVQARGKPEAITKAKDALLYTLIGAAILLGSWAIAEMISATVIELGS